MNDFIFLALLFAALSGFFFAVWYVRRQEFTLSFWLNGERVLKNKWNHLAVTGKHEKPKQEAIPMNVRDFAVKVTKLEGKKKSVNIAQVMEILKIVRGLLKPVGVDIYAAIRKLKK